MNNYGIAYMDGWEEVITIYQGSWEWSEFMAYWSPAARRYFWDEQSGCSCYGWEFEEAADGWENGDRAALLRAVDDFYTDTPEEKHEAKMSVRNFKES